MDRFLGDASQLPQLNKSAASRKVGAAKIS